MCPTPQSGREPTPLELELRAERAAAMDRSGRRLRRSLEELRRFDQMHSDCETAESGVRGELLASAAEAWWAYMVQREALGLTSHAEAVREYQVPGEVLKGTGITRARR
jgi:hypothetical protein